MPQSHQHEFIASNYLADTMLQGIIFGYEAETKYYIILLWYGSYNLSQDLPFTCF